MSKAITHLFEESVLKYSDRPYLWEKKADKYVSLSYSKTRTEVLAFAAGLISYGVAQGDRVALFAEGKNEWVIGELGVLYAGAVSVPMSVKLSEPDELIFRLVHSGAKYVITSQYQARKLQPILDKVPDILSIIVFDDEVTLNTKEIFFSQIQLAGRKYLAENAAEVEKRWKSVKPDDYATICYTSGTTADPKGIILTHRNYTANTEQSLSLIDVPEDYLCLLILPWDHSFAHTCGIYTMMKAGASIASIQVGKSPMETLKNIPVNIKETKPSFLLSVPALAKNFRKNIESGIAAKGKIVESLFKAGLKVGYLYNGIGWNRGKGLRFLLYPIYKLFDAIVFKKVRENFGGRLRFFVGGGALLDIELQRFFYAIGIPMMQGYGLTEAAPVISSNSLTAHKMGSSGKVVANLELKILDDKGIEQPVGSKGEIVIRGENVMAGYWMNTEATEQSLKNGWLHTGDMGYMDKDGFLYVLGRFKSLLIADDGEKYSPEGIEEAIVGQSPYIDQCMLYNNQNPYTVALIVPNKESIKRYLRDKKIEILSNEAVESALKLIEHEVTEYRTGRKYEKMFPQRWLPASLAILDQPFSEENHMLNSTLKLVRNKVVEYYRDRIQYLYTPEAKEVLNMQNKDAVRKLLS